MPARLAAGEAIRTIPGAVSETDAAGLHALPANREGRGHGGGQ